MALEPMSHPACNVPAVDGRPSGREPVLRGVLTQNADLSRYNTWRVGGAARRLYRPADAVDLAHCLAMLSGRERLLWLGLGSNVLVRDGGFDGTVIMTHGTLNEIRDLGNGAFRAGAGAPCNKLARFIAKRGYVGAEFLAGIPGTWGGALAMNAGAFGGETWSLVTRVETIDGAGVRRERRLDAYRIGYRSVQGPAAEWYLSAELQTRRGDAAAATAAIRALLAQRQRTQPIGVPSCGSVFRNPPGDYAARLIEACGLKGACEGGAQVSPKHANFIINRGHACAADIETLIRRIQSRVRAAFDVALHPEVHIVGERLR